MPEVFVSYRRTDTPAHAGRLFDCLQSNFGESKVFMDVDSAAAGEDIEHATKGAVTSCDVVLAVIGDEWLGATNGSEQRSLDNPGDPVRLQLEHAFKGGVKVIPVLVEGAHLPAPQDLPPSLSRLSRSRGLELSDAHWRHDTEQLLEAVGASESGRVRKWVKKSPVGRYGRPAISGIRVVSTLVTAGRLAVAGALLAAAAVSGLGILRGSDDGAPDFRSFKLRAPELTVDAPAEWSVAHLDGSTLVLEPTDGLPPVRLTSKILGRSTGMREYAAGQRAKYRRTLDAYRELEVGPVQDAPAWRGGFMRLFVFDSPEGSAQRPNARLEVYYSLGRRMLTGSAQTALKPPVEFTLHRLREAVLDVAPAQK